MKAVLFLYVLYVIFIKSFMVKGTSKCGSQVELRAVLLSCPVRDNGCEENDPLSETMDAEQVQFLQANGRDFETLREERTSGFPNAVKDCKRKLVITMRVKNVGKVPCDDKYIVVDHVYDPITGGRGRLLSPVVLKLRQEQMIQLYGLQFQRVVNNDPYEEQISKGKFCSVSPDNPTCGVATYDGKPIPFSEGFCCSCSPHINAKRELSPVSHGDSFIYSDSKLIFQDRNHLTHEVGSPFINPELVQSRSKKEYDVSKSELKYLKRLNSDKVPNYLLEKDRKIVCDKGDFMNELCNLKEEKMKLDCESEKEQNEEFLKEKDKSVQTGAMTTQTSVPTSLNSKFMLRNSVLNGESKTTLGSGFKPSRGKRENRHEKEGNSLEENLERFLRTKKLHRNRRKRLLEISHRPNWNREMQTSAINIGQNLQSSDCARHLPPKFFFTHDRLVINPMEAIQVNTSEQNPLVDAYNGLKSALERNRFDSKWDKNTRKPYHESEEMSPKEDFSHDINNNLARGNVKAQEYSLSDKIPSEKDQRFPIQREGAEVKNKVQNQKGEQLGDVQTYFNSDKMGNDERSKMRNYFLSKNTNYMKLDRVSDATVPGEEEKTRVKDYNEVSKEMKNNAENNYEEVVNLQEKIKNIKTENENIDSSQILDKPYQEEYEANEKREPDARKFVQTPEERRKDLPRKSKSEEEAFDFNVEITHQDFPKVTEPQERFKSTDQKEMASYLKSKAIQSQNKAYQYQFSEKNRLNFPQDAYIIDTANGPLEVRRPYFHLKGRDRIQGKSEKCHFLASFYKKHPNYFEQSSRYSEWPDVRSPNIRQDIRADFRSSDHSRDRKFRPSFERQRTNDDVELEDSKQDSEEEPMKNNKRERRSVKEFEHAKGYLASDIKLTPRELDVCHVESEKKTAEMKPININAAILSELPKLRRRFSQLDIKKTQRSTKTDLDRLIQSYLSAPEYVLRRLETVKDGIGEVQQVQKQARNYTCGKSSDGENTKETAHCLRFGDLWYSLYNIRKPTIAQTVGLQLFDKRTLSNGRTRWKDLTKGKMIRLGTFISSAEDDLSSVSLTFSGEESDSLYSSIDPDNYVLLIPSHLSDPSKVNFYPQLEGGPDEYLLVNRKDTTFGGECNKIGTTFEAFARQPKRCVRSRGSCLQRQPIDLWREDMEARIRGKMGKYFVENFGTTPNSPVKSFTNLSGEYLAVEYYGDYTSTIEIELKADHNIIVRKGRSTAQISTVYIDGTHPKKTKIFMTVLNTGFTTASFRPRLQDYPPDLDPSRCPLDGTPVNIPPQKRHDFKLDLPVALPANNLRATVQVLNQENKPIAQRKIKIKRGERCLCAFHCKCNCLGNAMKGKVCKKLNEDEYKAAGYMGPPPFRKSSTAPRGFLGNLRLVFLTIFYILLLFGIIKGILGAYFRQLGNAGLRIIVGPRKIFQYYEPELQGCTVLYDQCGFPIHPTSCRPVQIVPLCYEVLLNFLFFFLYPIRGLWLIIKSSICLKIVFGDCSSSGQCRDSDHKCSSPLLSQQNICVNYNVTTITSKKCHADEFLPYLPYRGDNDPLEEDDTEFVLQEMQKHKTK